ncbi:hypothetical protein [Paenibacillus taichungensis]|uniref:hypothetical protein n=1 Tax=Paenibacillus taichungensis TaxID=484184 RepID=UPI001FE55EF3|nr:hypothetical protein [Paenibacillus taichungensis]
MINKDAKHPEAIFLYYNYLLDNLANPAAGSEYEYGFAKGYDWDIIDGQPTSDKEKIKDFSNEFLFLTGPARIPDLYMKTLVKLANCRLMPLTNSSPTGNPMAVIRSRKK